MTANHNDFPSGVMLLFILYLIFCPLKRLILISGQKVR